ncbi:MAG: CHASE2 domain-containing protein [Candidatus Omnitrophica bacterium]|nr:CHASE2 domain-containing protein [Candidatus Omnitrophota bacterium]
MNKKRYIILALISIVSILPLFFSFPYLSRLSLGLDDFSSQIFYSLNKKSIDTSHIVLVAIDDYSFKKIGQSWPMRRSLYAKALNILNGQNVKVVGFDLIFEGESPLAADDEAFTTAIKDFNGKVILGYFWDKSGLHLPKKEFMQQAAHGFINSLYDSDGIERKCISYVKFNNFSDVSFAIKIASAYKNYSQELMNNIIPRQKTEPLNFQEDGIEQQYIFDVNYLARPNDIKTISLYDLINENFPAGLFKDKIVLIAPTLGIAHDIHSTPLGVMPGVFIHINIILDILEGKLAGLVPIIISLFLVVAILIVSLYILSSFTFLRGIFLYLGTVLCVLWLNIVLRFFNWYFPLGNIIVCSLVFTVFGSFYNYAVSVAFLVLIKNKLIKDPLTNLFNIRYFSERLYLEAKSIFNKKKYLVVLFLNGYKAYSKAQNFEQLKNTWNRISVSLFSVSNLWARYTDDIVVGLMRRRPDLAYIKNMLNDTVAEKGIKIKLSAVNINTDTDVLEASEFMISEIQKSPDDVIFLERKQLPKDTHHKIKHEQQLYSLSLAAEDKNAELLNLIGQLKGEEQKIKEAYFELMASLVTALESKDAYTKGHTQRVCNYSLMLAQKLSLSPEEKERIRKAALLHDLGKIGIPDSVLHKKGQLTDEEFSIIKEHEIISAKILEPIKEFKDIIPYILYHHENFDGSGYPHGLAADFIPLGARIIAVADMFDALTTGRSYKQAFSVEESVSEIQKAKGKKLDPVLADKFIEALRDFHILSST